MLISDTYHYIEIALWKKGYSVDLIITCIFNFQMFFNTKIHILATFTKCDFCTGLFQATFVFIIFLGFWLFISLWSLLHLLLWMWLSSVQSLPQSGIFPEHRLRHTNSQRSGQFQRWHVETTLHTSRHLSHNYFSVTVHINMSVCLWEMQTMLLPPRHSCYRRTEGTTSCIVLPGNCTHLDWKYHGNCCPLVLHWQT